MNQRINIRILASVMVAFVSPVLAVDLTNAEGNKIAVRMENLITQSDIKLKALVANAQREKYGDAIRQPLQDAINGWPADNLKNRAIFPYFSCRQAAIDLLQLGHAWLWNDQSKVWRDHLTKNLHMDHAACKKAIKHPDLSLKNIQ